MNYFYFTIATFFIVCCEASFISQVTSRVKKPAEVRDVLPATMRQNRNCKLDICFAIDGSGSERSENFLNEEEFVLVASGRIHLSYPNSKFAAVQYSGEAREISDLTDDLREFQSAVLRTRQIRRSTDIAAGIRLCMDKLPSVPGEVKKIIVLGDGGENREKAIPVAKMFRDNGGEICSVLAGSISVRGRDILMNITGGDPKRLFEAKSFGDVGKLNDVLDQITANMCA